MTAAGTTSRAPLLPLLALSCLFGCSGPHTEVRDNYDPDTDWGRIHSFVWFGIQSRGGISEFDVKRVANAIRDDLSEKGLREVGDRSLADVGVAAYLGVVPKAVDTWKRGDGLLWTKGKDLVSAGALAVEVIDLAQGAVVWRGIAERELLQNPSRAEADRAIGDTVRKLLAGFPPSP